MQLDDYQELIGSTANGNPIEKFIAERIIEFYKDEDFNDYQKNAVK